MLRFLSGFVIALLISMPLAGQQGASLQSSVHLNEGDVPWPEPVTDVPDAVGEMGDTAVQDYRRMDAVMRWKTLIGTGGRFGEALPDPDIGFGLGELGPGAIYPAHRHPAPELYYFVSGSVRWNVDGEVFVATPGSTM